MPIPDTIPVTTADLVDQLHRLLWLEALIIMLILLCILAATWAIGGLLVIYVRRSAQGGEK